MPKLKVKNKSGKVVEYPATKIKSLLGKVGFTGKLLVSATSGVFKEAKKVTKEGVISVTNLEKAIVKSVSNTNKIAMNTTQKIAKKVLK
jgi:hypothetical protein